MTQEQNPGLLGWLKRRPAAQAGAPQTHADDAVLVAFASQTGLGESIAWRTAEALRAGGKAVRLVSFAEIEPQDLSRVNHALFIASSTGSGEAPDSARAFTRKMRGAPPNLSHLRYRVLALGDRSYENFCAYGDRLGHWLRAAGAEAVAPTIHVDNGDMAAIERWRAGTEAFGAAAAPSAWAGPPFQRWRLAARTMLNPGSPGAPVFHIALGALAAPPPWAAGDIVEVFPGRAQEVFLGGALEHRDYSAASVPSDGRLEMVVRQLRFPDGRLGPASAWLTETAAVGGPIAIRIRENSAFHAPPADTPMILIGNGAGIAGLRAHLRARAVAGARRNWLIFGERTRAHDYHFREEIEAWRASGHLARLDLAFSRDGPQRVYVQQLVAEAGEDIRAWIEQGAAIYVCGGAAGMGAGVDTALQALLGPAPFSQWAERGLYRRDVY